MHPGATHLLQRDLLPHHHLGHPRRPEIHRRVGFDHDHQVAEGGDVRAARRAGPEQAADLRHLAGQRHLVAEDPPGSAPAGKQVDLVGDPGARGVDEPEDRQLIAERDLSHPDDLLDRPRAPGSRLHTRVVGDHEGGPALDQTAPGDHPVGRQTVGQGVGELAVLGERIPDRRAGRSGPGRRACSPPPASRPPVRGGARVRSRAAPISFMPVIPPEGRAAARSGSAGPPRCPRRSPAPWRRDRTGRSGTPP